MHTRTAIAVPLHPLLSVLTWLYLVSMMFALGLELGGTPKASRAQKRAKRFALVRGFVLGLIVLPLVTFSIARALHAPHEITVALVLLAACPGGRFAPHIVKFGGGDTALAAELTLWLAKLTCFTAVPTVEWMLKLRSLHIEELPLLVQLFVLQLAPLFFGKWLRRAHPSLGNRCSRPANRIALVVAVATFAVVLFRADRGIFSLLDPRGWVAVAAVGVAAPLIALIGGGRNEAERRTLVIGANAREVALALVLAGATFPQRAVQTAIFGIWVLHAVSTLVVARAMRSIGGARSVLTPVGGHARPS